MDSISSLIVAAAQQQGVDPSLALEVATTESGLNQAARSSKGAIGVFQLMPHTAAGLGVDPTDLNQNIQGGVAYLGQLLGQFGDPVQAVAAYNAGPGAVAGAIARYGTTDFISAAPGAPSIPAWLAGLPAETQNYVLKIFGNVSAQYPAYPAMPSSGTPAIPDYVASTPPATDDTMYMVFATLGLVALVLYANS